MRSVQVVSAEGPSGVRVTDVPEPVRGEGEVLVEVHALGVSWPDRF
jgi:NADPH2:quinone reductase